MVRVWKTKSLLFCLRYDPLIVLRRQNHMTFIFLKTTSHDLLVQMAHCWLFRRYHSIRYIDRSRGKWFIQDEIFHFEKVHFPEHFQVIIKQQLPWLPACVRYYRINLFKTVFKYSFWISFYQFRHKCLKRRSNSLYIYSRLWQHSIRTSFLISIKDVVTATTLLTSSLTCVKGKVKVTST